VPGVAVSAVYLSGRAAAVGGADRAGSRQRDEDVSGGVSDETRLIAIAGTLTGICDLTFFLSACRCLLDGY
jgi:hypothetical protein